ncbi:MAG: exodeoxyribonuclease VII small subunit [Odoribacteraceae bacterium]|jgi:exodeoxyribonuclease VII small subunit|nr:exodeoxyribonuclease VII small subunit [Odoribacteraceae bacterium]
MDKLTYKEAIKEIEQMIEKLEANELDVDDLGEKVKRVAWLVAFCKTRLHDTEVEVEKILRSIEE